MYWIIPALFTAFSEATKDYFSKRAMQKINYYTAAWSLMTLPIPFLLTALVFVGLPNIGPTFLPIAIANSMLYILSVVLYMKAISNSPLSLILPILSFTPVFMLLTSPIILNEFPKTIGLIGLVFIAAGVYVLNVKDMKKGLLAPFVSLAKNKSSMLMLAVALIWSITGVTGKYLVNQSSPVFTMFSQYVISAVAFSMFAFATRKINIKDISKNLKNVISIGFFTALSEIGLAYTFTLTLAAYTIAAKRLSIVIGSIYGFKFFKEGNVVQRLSGSLLTVLGIILIVL